MGPFDVIVGYDPAGILSRNFALEYKRHVATKRSKPFVNNSCRFARVPILHVTERQTDGRTEIPWL